VNEGPVLVTGASGFLGSHLCASLAARGESLRALYRRARPPAELAALAANTEAVELMRGDLEEAGDAERAVRGVRALIHAAALASDWGEESAFRAANVSSTLNLLDAAERAGCPTFIHISSAAVQGFGPHEDTTEEGPYHPLHFPYQTSKQEAERLVLERNRPGFRTTAIRPCNVYGPGDRTSTYVMFAAILDATFGWLGDGSAYTCPLYIEDLCDGVLLALDAPESGGEAILLSDGVKMTWKRYVELMYKALGSEKRPTALPVRLARPAARFMSFLWRLRGSEHAPPLTPYRVEQASSHYHFSNRKARALLGFQPKVFCEEGLVLTARAFLAERAEGGDRSLRPGRPGPGRA
jgi:nucleoside-diphosphate-sugar epimerase